VKLTKKEIFRRDHYTCQYCGKSGPNLTVDHVVPQRLGGKSTWENLVTACARCNHKKGGKPLVQSGLKLQSAPKKPPSSARYLFSKYLKKYEEWEPFIRGW
jgi:5-methylcytosine-specific restriction endonuclease McrA